MKAPSAVLSTVAALAFCGAAMVVLGSQRPAAPGRAPALSLPAIALSPKDVGQVTKLEISRPDDDDPAHRLEITLERHRDSWEMTTPIETQASAARVEEALANLANLHLWKEVDSGTNYYERYDLTESRSLHLTAWRGTTKVVDLLCGKGSLDGQLVRVPAREGIYALINWGPQGYRGFLFTGSVRSWRESAIFKFDPGEAEDIDIINPHGIFSFTKHDGAWTAKRSGPQVHTIAPWREFKASRIELLLRDYQSLAADNFGDRASRPTSGVDEAERVGGIIGIHLRGGATMTLRVGKPANDTSRFAIKDSRWAVKDGGDGTLYAISPYTAGWATGDARRFE